MRATRMTPLVSRSRRWTIPVRGTAAALTRGPNWNCKAPATIPACPCAGWTTMPAGLLTTTSSSSW